MEIKLIGTKEGKWFDKFSKEVIEGKMYDFEIKDASKLKRVEARL